MNVASSKVGPRHERQSNSALRALVWTVSISVLILFSLIVGTDTTVGTISAVLGMILACVAIVKLINARKRYAR